MNVPQKPMNVTSMPNVPITSVVILVLVTLVLKALDVLVKISMSVKLMTTLVMVSMPCARIFQEHMIAVVQMDTTWMLQSFQVVSSQWDAQMPMNVLSTVTTVIEIMVSVTTPLVVGNVNVPLVGNSLKPNFLLSESVLMMVKPVSTLMNAPEVHLNVILMQHVSTTLVVTPVNVTLDSPVTVKHAWTLMNVLDACWLDQMPSHVTLMLSVPTLSVDTLVLV